MMQLFCSTDTQLLVLIFVTCCKLIFRVNTTVKNVLYQVKACQYILHKLILLEFLF